VGQVRELYVAVNGDHPMTEADDAYVREHFVPATSDAMAAMVEGRLPLPSYVLADGTPMVPKTHAKILEDGGDDPHAWWLTWWPANDQAAAEDEWRAFLSGQYVCLQEPGPGSVRRKNKWAAQLDDALAILGERPGDHIGRGMLGEAVERLESFMLPQTPYDELRFGSSEGTWRRLVKAKADHLSPRPPALPIRTERLVLRDATEDDLDEMLAYYGRDDVAEHLLHPPFTRGELQERLRRDDPPENLGVVIELDGEVVGDVVLMVEGPAYDSAELGWVVSPAHSGKGIATEAAQALIDIAFTHYGLRRVRAELDARNDRSAALAERLGMTKEAHLRQDYWSKGEWTDTPHYALLVDEWKAQQRP
jgi:RimJ/RimL family protein N-acetyltransferase